MKKFGLILVLFQTVTCFGTDLGDFGEFGGEFIVMRSIESIISTQSEFYGASPQEFTDAMVVEVGRRNLGSDPKVFSEMVNWYTGKGQVRLNDAANEVIGGKKLPPVNHFTVPYFNSIEEYMQSEVENADGSGCQGDCSDCQKWCQDGALDSRVPQIKIYNSTDEGRLGFIYE